MQITLGNDKWESLEPTKDIQNFIEKVEETLRLTDLYYVNMIVDGEQVFEPYEKYLVEHAEQVGHAELIAKTYKQIKNDMLLSLDAYLIRAHPLLERLAEMLYQGADQMAWQQLNDLADSLDWILQVLPNLGANKETYQNADQYLILGDQLKEKILLLADGIDASDTSQLADVIQYELLPLLESLAEVITHTMNNEGIHHDHN